MTLSNTTDQSTSSNRTIQVSRKLNIPLAEIVLRFSRSGGKGGQNVNKVETKVELLFDVAHSPTLNDVQRGVLLQKLGSRVDSDGVLHIIAQASRSQWENREDAIKRFAETLQKALTPTKKRIKTKASKASKERRISSKKKRGEIKRMRSSRTAD